MRDYSIDSMQKEEAMLYSATGHCLALIKNGQVIDTCESECLSSGGMSWCTLFCWKSLDSPIPHIHILIINHVQFAMEPANSLLSHEDFFLQKIPSLPPFAGVLASGQ